MNNSARVNVLIIDDNPLTRLGLKTALEQQVNFCVAEAESGELGLDLAQKNIPDILVTSMNLPGMNGIETTKQIKEIDENIKIVFLTSKDSIEEVMEAFCAGAQAYCLKNIQPERLVHVIDFVKEGAAWFDPAITKDMLDILTKNKSVTSADNTNCESTLKAPLTDRERDVLSLIVDGYSNAEISERLVVSIHTAKAHVCNILHKLSVEDRTQAAIKALKDKII